MSYGVQVDRNPLEREQRLVLHLRDDGASTKFNLDFDFVLSS